jgi:hypothetical protein
LGRGRIGRAGDGAGDPSAVGGAVGSGVAGIKVHIPTRRWQRVQWSIGFSAFFALSVADPGETRDVRLRVKDGRRTGVEGPSVGVLSLVLGSEVTDGAREGPLIDIAEPVRELDGVCGRSEG